jgi:hypothetical protein
VYMLEKRPKSPFTVQYLVSTLPKKGWQGQTRLHSLAAQLV